MKRDLTMWEQFLFCEHIFMRPFLDLDNSICYTPQDFYTDATAKSNLGRGGYFKNNWFITQWDKFFIESEQPSINYLELFALTAAYLLWGGEFKNRAIYCDNQTVIHMVNNGTSSCPNCMVLIRILTLFNMKNNTKLRVEYVKSENNTFADLLSRLKYKQFRIKAREHKSDFNNSPTTLPQEIWNKYQIHHPLLRTQLEGYLPT